MSKTGAERALENKEGNRTGIQTSPEMARELIEGAMAAAPSSEGGPEEIARYRADYIQEGFPIGSLPSLPAAEEAAATEEVTATAVLFDKLSERLAFERMGTRLYEALINKCEVLGESSPGPTLDQLRQIRDEELQHFLLLNRAIKTLGGDPTVMSPCADVTEVASMGILQVLTDPRTTVTQSLQAILTAELTDNDGWRMLINLSDNLGYTEFSDAFRNALKDEDEHLSKVRGWVSERVLDKAQV